MTQQVKKKLNDSWGMRWGALAIVAFTMMAAYYVNDVVAPLKSMLEADLAWSSSDTSVVTIDSTGQYTVVGDSGSSAVITATLKGNTSVISTITIQVVDTQSVQPLVVLNPTFSKIRQCESIDFTVEVMYGSMVVVPENVDISLSPDSQILSNQYLTITHTGSQYKITANAIALNPQVLYVTVQNTTPSFQTTEKFTLNVVSMFG